jgi:nucleotide-binding universal stress UspA family protein
MKLLIAYDGSKSSEAAIDDLAAAGLPAVGAAEVVSVAEVWLPPLDAIDNSAERQSAYVESIVRRHRERSDKVIAEASIRARHAEARVRAALPDWDVHSHSTCGSPTWEILTAADEQGSDLIVVGSHGHSGIGRLVLGSISHTVLTEAKCSVRVARGRNEVDPAPGRIVIGFDGSKGASAAVDAVAGRNWRTGTKVKLLAATEPLAPSGIGRFILPVRKAVEAVNVIEDHWIADLAQPALEKLRNAGIDAHFHMHSGNPKHLLVEEAENWGADCIFLGANAWGGRLARILLGSTASAVAARAHCSVEAIRVREAGHYPITGDAGGNGNSKISLS